MAQYTSFLIRLWNDSGDGARRYEIRHVQTGQEVVMPEASFMLTLWGVSDTKAVRGSIKNVETGEVLRFQSSERLLEFLASHLALPTGQNGGEREVLSTLLGLRPAKRKVKSRRNGHE